MTTAPLRVARMLSDNIQNGIQDSAFKYILKVKKMIKQTK